MALATSIIVSFRTTGDDKDWDTQVRDRVVVNGADMATLFCCSADHESDHWIKGSTNARPMTIVQQIQKGSLQGGTFVLGEVANGHDQWIFIPTLTVNYDDGTKEEWTFQETTLTSDNNLIEQPYPIPAGADAAKA